MCRRRPRGRARSRAPNNMPSAVLVLLRTPGNKFFEKPTRAHKACKSATFLHRPLHCAIRRRRACRRKAGTLMEFPPPSRLCGDPLDIRHTAGEKSTRARDPNKLQRTDSWSGLVRRHPGPQPNLNLYTRSLQSRAAMPLIPSSPKWRRPGQAARAQSSESPTEIPEASGEGEKNPIHRAEGDPRQSSANPRELSGSQRKRLSEMLQRERSNAALRPSMGKTRRVRWRGECGDPTSRRSFSRSRVAKELLIPCVVVLLGPGTRHVAANDGAKSTAFHRCTHIDVNDKKRDGSERAYRVHKHGGETQETQIPGNVLREPQNQPGKQ